jgi:hypothetical protein
MMAKSRIKEQNDLSRFVNANKRSRLDSPMMHSSSCSDAAAYRFNYKSRAAQQPCMALANILHNCKQIAQLPHKCQLAPYMTSATPSCDLRMSEV